MLKHRGQIQVQEVRNDEFHILRELWNERRSQITIDFDGGQVRDAGSQPQCQRARTGADLQETILGLGTDRLHKLVSPGGLEEVLPESLPRTHRSVVVQRVAAPVLLFDLLDLLLTHPEVVAELVDHRLGDAVANLFVVFAGLENRASIDRDAIGQ